MKDLVAIHVIALLIVAGMAVVIASTQSPLSELNKLLIMGGVSIAIYDGAVALWKIVEFIDE